MSRSQGAPNGGWQTQRNPAGEPDPRTAGRPAQRPQQPQYAAPGQPGDGHPQQPGPQAGYGEPQAAPAYNAQQAYHYPQQPQYAPQAPAPTAPPANRQGLSSLESARSAQPTHDFENYPRTQPQYAPQAQGRQPQHQQQVPQRGQQQAVPADHNPIHAAGGYRQMAPQAAPQYAPRAPQQNPAANFGPAGYDQWPAPAQPAHDPRGYDLGGYLPGDTPFPANSNHPGSGPHMDPLQQADWAMPAANYGDPSLEQQGYRGGQGYDQPHGGALEPTYAQDETAAYEVEEPRRVSWTMRIAGAVVVAIGLGYGLAQAYKAVLGAAPEDRKSVV